MLLLVEYVSVPDVIIEVSLNRTSASFTVDGTEMLIDAWLNGCASFL